ncbi:hypothetical protein [Thermoplasma acidophilum]|uniref:Uncharacterized protein n=1 Tax=Thermoplasma acidophilum (strain ATCC 25905 / DSM 1728 / JCM 9062 / NBRC 15155 / AMRC-C165) TaxID=273075 RepID=Q9HK39_THEAC|nr:hypothetical protein [Thermoplasma acidophilum]
MFQYRPEYFVTVYEVFYFVLLHAHHLFSGPLHINSESAPANPNSATARSARAQVQKSLIADRSVPVAADGCHSISVFGNPSTAQSILPQLSESAIMKIKITTIYIYIIGKVYAFMHNVVIFRIKYLFIIFWYPI